MLVDTTSDPDVIVITLGADLGLESARELTRELGPTLDAGGRVVVSLQAVPSISATGLRTLVLLTRRATASGGTLVLSSVPEPLRDLMDVTGFIDSLRLAEGDVEALDLARSQPTDGAPS